MNFKESDKLVCIDDKGWWFPDAVSDLPLLGRVYVCRGVANKPELCGHCDRPSHGVHLVGINTYVNDGDEVGFCANRFRKLDDLKAEVALAKSLTKLGIKALTELDNLRTFREISPDAPWRGKQ